ncbi:MAG: transporter, partial [Rhizobiales bacterium]|nr:transporter [Hyphomicrobiales bacterium]
PGAGSQFGLGDVVQSFFFAPKPVALSGNASFIFGIGPVFLLPIGTDDFLTSGKWGAGPTAVGLVQSGPWTVGALANHIWSFAGNSNRDDVNATLLMPFISYTTPNAISFSLNTESTYNWEDTEWSVPINFGVSKLTRIGTQPVSFGVGARYWAETTPGGPEGWGATFTTTYLFPK